MFLILFKIIYFKIGIPLNISLEFLIFSKLKLEISKATNSEQFKNIESILLIKEN